MRTVTPGEYASAVSDFLPETADTRLAGRLGTSGENSKVTAIRLPDSLVTIGNSAFSNHQRVSGDLIIPASVDSIGTTAFWYLGTDSSVNLKFARGSVLNSIGVRAFQFANIVSMEQLPRSLETIEAFAFESAFPSSASFQSNFIIPGNVRKVGDNAFGTGHFTGTLTIESPRLTKPNLGNDILQKPTVTSSRRLTTIILPSTVFESYTQAELNAIFRPLQAGGKYLDLADKTTELTK